MAQGDSGTSVARRLAFPLAALVVIAVHLALIAHFVGVTVFLDDAPGFALDFDTHISQTWRVIEGLDGWRRSWVYDVQLLAGAPTGAIFDADNKAWELWTYALWKLGMSKGAAFDLFPLVAHLLVLPVVYGAAHLFGLGRGGALFATGLGSLVWFFDSFSHWCWLVGMVAYAFASYLALLPLALFYRFCREFRPWQGIAAALSLAVCHLIHPYTFFILAAPMLVIYGRAFRSMTRRQHAAVVAVAATTIVVNGWWLAVALSLWHYILDSAYFGQAGVEFLLYDLLNLVVSPQTSGLIGTRTAARALAWGAAIAGLWLWRRDGDPRVRPLGVAFALLFVLTYFGSYSHALAQIQPYRHVLPLLFIALVPAGALFERVIAETRARPRSAGALASWVLAAVAGKSLAVDATYYFAGSLPDVQAMPDGITPLMSATGHVGHPDYSRESVAVDHDEIDAWVRATDDGSARFLVDYPHLGEHLTWATGAQVIGGFTLRNLQHSAANLFRRHPRGIVEGPEASAALRRYFETYAVRFVIVPDINDHIWQARVGDVVEYVRTIDHQHIYRTKIRADLIAEGGGKVRASTNRLAVTGSAPDRDVVLRFHWLETLACAPDCALVREPIEGDPVGFLRVPAPHPADFTIENVYEARR